MTLLALTFLIAIRSWAAEPTFVGVSETDKQRLKRDVPAAFQDDLTYQEVDDVIRALSLPGQYEQVLAVEDSSGQIRISAKPVRAVKEIRIRGNRSFDQSTLMALVDIKTGQRFERKRIIQAGENLKQFYGEQGFFNTIIEANFTKENEGALVIEFLIDEKQPCIMKEITIVSENKELAERIQPLLYRVQGKPLTSERIETLRNRIEAFLKEHRYLKTELIGPEAKYNSDKTESALVYRLNDPYRFEFITSGYQQMNDNEVYKTLSPDTIERGSADPATDAVERIRLGYLKLGFPNVEVTHRTAEIKNRFLRRIRIDIKENERVRISEIEITGRISRPSSYYESFLKKNSSDLIRRGFYNRQDLENGFNNLVIDLRNQGYLRAKVQSSRLEMADQPGIGRVVVFIDEGPLTQLRTIEFNGNSSFTATELLQALKIRDNTALRLSDLERSIEEIKTFYRSRGYLEMRLLNEGEELITYNDRGTQAMVKFEIFEGPKVIVASITTDGNSFTRNDVLLRTAGLKPGDVLTPEKIEDAETRLNRLGIFSRVTIRTLEEGTNVSRRNVIIAVGERDPGVFRLGAGATSERDLTLRGFTSIGYNNIRGTARGVSTRAEIKSHVVEVNYPQYEVVAGYFEPFLLDSKASGRVNITRSERIFNYDSRADVTQVTTSNKIDLFVERDFGKHWRLNWKFWSIDARREFEVNRKCIDDNGVVTGTGCSATSQQIATLGPIIEYDHRDNPFSPTRGHFTNFNLDFSHPSMGSSNLIHFIRTEAGHTRYFRIAKSKHVWANSLRGGYVANLSNEGGSGVPASHAFFLGGQSTVRGFGGSDENERIPPDYLLSVGRGNQLLIKRDSYYLLFKSEVRFSVVGEHGAVLFYDGGLVQVTGKEFPRPYRDAVGIGYRYNTPLGPLSIDLGFKINPNTDNGKREEPFRVHFSVGTF